MSEVGQPRNLVSEERGGERERRSHCVPFEGRYGCLPKSILQEMFPWRKEQVAHLGWSEQTRWSTQFDVKVTRKTTRRKSTSCSGSGRLLCHRMQALRAASRPGKGNDRPWFLQICRLYSASPRYF